MRTRMSEREAWQEVRNLQAIEAKLERTDAAERRARAYFFGRMFAPQFDVSAEEIIGAILRVRAEVPGDWRGRIDVADDVARMLARELATDQRREQLRRAVGGLANAIASPMPLLSQALREALATSPPDDPGEDLLWIQLVIGLTYHRLS